MKHGLALGVGIMLVAFPAAHGMVLTALYLPVAITLLGLMVRGVAFDFRTKAHDKHKARWIRAFAMGSLVAAMSQGWMLGAYVSGFREEWWTWAFNAVIALTVPAAYVVLGAGWLIMKAEGELHDRAVVWARKAILPFMFGVAAVSIATPLISETIFNKWFKLPGPFALLPIPLITGVAFATLWHVTGKKAILNAGYGCTVFAAMVPVLILATLGLAYSIYPYVVIDRLNVWEAASATSSLLILAVGTLITLPAIIGYTIFVNRIFWGTAREPTHGA